MSSALRVLALLALGIGCAGKPAAPATERSSSPSHAESPAARGPIELRAETARAPGVRHRILFSYTGRTELSSTNASLTREPQLADELLSLQLDFTALPVPNAPQGELVSLLVLDAVRRQARASASPQQDLEAAEDRLRVDIDAKQALDLRGAQPKGDLTPRAILNKPFALLGRDRLGNPRAILLRGIPAAKRLLATLPLREVVGYLQLAYPEKPVSPGDSWRAKRYAATPLFRTGVALDIEYRLIAFETLSGVECARIALRASRDDEDVPSEHGFTFKALRYQLHGDAWVDLANGDVVLLRVQDDTAVSFDKTAGAVQSQVRTRYETRASYERLDVPDEKGRWADGSRRFADKKK